MIVGVTGSIGSGKSTISRILAASLGAVLINSDEVCRQELLPGRSGLVAVEERWGRRFLSDAGTLDRSALRAAAFHEPGLLQELEAVFHPLVHRHILLAASQQRKSGGWLVAEVPLLFEVGWQEDFDCTVAVRVGLQSLFARVEARDGRSREEVEKILSAQLPMEKKVEMADYCIDNSSFLSNTVSQVYWLTRILRKRRRV